MSAVLFIVFVVGLAVGVPIALAMGGAGLLALAIDGNLSLLSVPQRFFDGINSFPLMAVPFFILAADLMTASGITTALLRFAGAMVGHVRGGMGHVNVVTSVMFAGISGSALADAAGPGAIETRMMARSGYDKAYSAALSAATSVIGPIIPPSIVMVIYALTDSRVTVAGLFLAGVVPGLLMGLALMAMNHYLSLKRGYGTVGTAPSWGVRLLALWKATPVLLMPAIIIAGILTGLFTPTEASAVAVFYALFIGLFVTRTLNARLICRVLLQSGLVTSAALIIVSMASLFAWLLTLLQIPQTIGAAIGGMTTDPVTIMLIVMVFVLVCGLFIDTLPAVIILVPVLAPLSDQFGIHPLHFAMAIVLNLTIGLATPPVGGVLFVMSSVARLRLEELTRAILPLLGALLVVLLAVVFIPSLSTFVPGLFGYAR
ncbi:MAG: TRAP transporter large permease subunit [Hydrogenophaga sp.]|uniref:TRAP transporter large permease n=1 Tax=Hydrogenophaga sp. TaxID=1904254 RepID=UPI0016BA81F2|nr:TRAP transporter large permease [Hydrogenophaga sp.]NIM43754.1 TRAP transporter large permease subunit [Hydrogenophaga sp.]NIN28820.1 TRAP transporter large permease subunit [Hydrogenophaga sp.]NIN33279.1 TRAP transporter large permease subunit [Hydrogenophaga sp.]NIN57954.1 TRAP transporter large permease subunit [Hydrogenophaga sp.]NIO54252.1 TRAP transporter large permease subunit [Hydrogenophaga sp.]